eukprot:gene18483-133_t
MFALTGIVLLSGGSAQNSAQGWTRPKCGTPNTGQDIITEWGKTIDPSKPILPEYPRPQMTRPDTTYKNLNGLWEWQSASEGVKPTFGQKLTGKILVPFPVESCLSGIAENHPYQLYRTVVDKPFSKGQTLLQFGAVDWQAVVYVNGKLAGNHSGGYDGFAFDVTSMLNPTDNEIIVSVFDPSDSGPQPQGKQRVAAIERPGGDHYSPSSGIWQTVWFENVPSDGYFESLKIRTDMTSVYITGSVMGGEQPVGLKVDVFDNGAIVATANGMAGKEIAITIPSPKLCRICLPTGKFANVVHNIVFSCFAIVTIDVGRGALDGDGAVSAEVKAMVNKIQRQMIEFDDVMATIESNNQQPHHDLVKLAGEESREAVGCLFTVMRTLYSQLEQLVERGGQTGAQAFESELAAVRRDLEGTSENLGRFGKLPIANKPGSLTMQGVIGALVLEAEAGRHAAAADAAEGQQQQQHLGLWDHSEIIADEAED